MRYRAAVLGSTLLFGAIGAFVPASPVRAQAIPPPVEFKDADFKGYSTGTVLHLDVLQGLNIGGLPTGGLTGGQLANLELSFTGATVASKGTGGVTSGPNAATGSIVNEVDQVVQPVLPNAPRNLPGDRTYGRGSALELGLLTPLPTDVNTLVLAGKAEASAPPTSEVVDRSITVPINPIAYASLLRGQALANWDPNNCIVGSPLSFGRGFVADAQVLNTGAVLPGGLFEKPLAALDAPNPERAVSNSQSITRLVPQAPTGSNFGLMSETRMTIAPITLFKNTPGQITIEIIGEFLLRTVADGVNPATVYFGAVDQPNVVPVVRVTRAGDPNPVVNLALPTGPSGQLNQLSKTITGAVNTVLTPVLGANAVEISIAENPRAIGGTAEPTPAQDGTQAAAAVDIVRVRVLPNGLNALGLANITAGILDLRVGHMEARSVVPRGGIRCGIPVRKVSDKPVVAAGEEFTYTIAVDNPFTDCTLTNVRVVDTITVQPGIKYTILETNPTANAIASAQGSSAAPNTITWNDIGPIPPRQSKTLTIKVRVAQDTAAGDFTDNAKATANCATGSATGQATITVPVTGEVTVVVPRASAPGELNQVNSPGRAAELPRTGGDPTLVMLGLAALAGALGARRLSTAGR